MVIDDPFQILFHPTNKVARDIGQLLRIIDFNPNTEKQHLAAARFKRWLEQFSDKSLRGMRAYIRIDRLRQEERGRSGQGSAQEGRMKDRL